MAAIVQEAVQALANQNPNEISLRQRGMTPLKRTISAGGTTRVEIDGDYFHVFKAPVNDLLVAFDDGEPVPVEQGIGFRRYYKSFVLSSATGQTVQVYGGFGSVGDGRSTANVNTTVNISPGANIDNGGDVSCAAGAATQLLAADINRLYALIQNSSANSVTLRIGSATVGVANGIPLEPGSTLPYATTAAVFAWNPSGGAVTLSAAGVKV